MCSGGSDNLLEEFDIESNRLTVLKNLVLFLGITFGIIFGLVHLLRWLRRSTIVSESPMLLWFGTVMLICLIALSLNIPRVLNKAKPAYSQWSILLQALISIFIWLLAFIWLSALFVNNSFNARAIPKDLFYCFLISLVSTSLSNICISVLRRKGVILSIAIFAGVLLTIIILIVTEAEV